MKGRKKLLPVWLIITIDVIIIAAYVGSFYWLYYKTPRQLKSTGIKIVQQDIATDSQSNDTDTSDISSDITKTEEIDTSDNASKTNDNDNPKDTSNTAKPSTSAAVDETKTKDKTNTSDTSKTSETKSTNTEEVDQKTATNKAGNTKSSDSKTANSESTSKKSSNKKTSNRTKKAATTKKSTISSWAAKFADKFTDKVVSTENSYTSSDISITVKKQTEGSGSDLVTYYIADIYVADIKCLQSGFAENTYGIGYTDNVLTMDKSLNALLAINGDYYGNGGNGVVIRNGEAYRLTTSISDVCVLYYNGTMKTFSAEEFDVNQAIKEGAYQAWSFGPKLLDNSGNTVTDFVAEGYVKRDNPRSAIGYYEPGHYCLVVVDGRQLGYSKGMSLVEFSSFFKKLGCKAAYNLDGGKSSELTFNDAFVNKPCDGGREVSDCIIIKEVASK